MSIDLHELAESIGPHRYAGFAAHLAERAREIAAAVPSEQREIIGNVILVVGLIMAEEDPINLAGCVGAELILPTPAARR